MQGIFVLLYPIYLGDAGKASILSQSADQCLKKRKVTEQGGFSD